MTSSFGEVSVLAVMVKLQELVCDVLAAKVRLSFSMLLLDHNECISSRKRYIIYNRSAIVSVDSCKSRESGTWMTLLVSCKGTAFLILHQRRESHIA